MLLACGTAMRTEGLSRSAQVFTARSSRASTASEYQSSGVFGKSTASARSGVASIIDIMSILLPCSAAIAVPQVTSTGSNFTPRSAAICLPSDTPTPLAQSPDFGSFENHGGACVTPTRSAPRCLICASVLSAGLRPGDGRDGCRSERQYRSAMELNGHGV